MLRTHPAASDAGEADAASPRFAPGSGAAPLRLTAVHAPVLQRMEDPTGVPAELRQPLEEAPAQRAEAPKEAAKRQKRQKCESGRAERWGKETTCSRFGPVVGVREPRKGEKKKSINCINHWPFSVDAYARKQGLNGAASCKGHGKQIATVSFKKKEVRVLCTDTLPEKPDHVIELSPQAMLDLSGALENLRQVKVCYSGSKEAGLEEWNGALPSNPEVEQCLTKGCPVPEGTPKLKDIDWPRV